MALHLQCTVLLQTVVTGTLLETGDYDNQAQQGGVNRCPNTKVLHSGLKSIDLGKGRMESPNDRSSAIQDGPMQARRSGHRRSNAPNSPCSGKTRTAHGYGDMIRQRRAEQGGPKTLADLRNQAQGRRGLPNQVKGGGVVDGVAYGKSGAPQMTPAEVRQRQINSYNQSGQPTEAEKRFMMAQEIAETQAVWICRFYGSRR